MKKTLSLLLMLCLLFALCPAAAFAEEIVGENPDVVTGDFGDVFRYVYNKYHAVLFIHGEGPLVTGDQEPWDQYKDKIRRIVLDEGITSVPAGAFSGCKELASVCLPLSMETLDSGAFADCGLVSYVMSTGSRTELGKKLKEANIEAFRCAEVTRTNAKSLADEINNLEAPWFQVDYYYPGVDKRTLEEIKQQAFWDALDALAKEEG